MAKNVIRFREYAGSLFAAGSRPVWLDLGSQEDQQAVRRFNGNVFSLEVASPFDGRLQ